MELTVSRRRLPLLRQRTIGKEFCSSLENWLVD